MRLWPFRRSTRTARITLAPVTLGRHLAVRALVCVVGRGQDGPDETLRGPEQMTDAALLSLLDIILDGAPPRYADRDALVAVAVLAFDAWTDATQAATALGVERARAVVRFTGFGWSGGGLVGGESDGDPPEEMTPARMTLPEWAAARDLPLWEVVMQRCASASAHRFDESMRPAAHHNMN